MNSISVEELTQAAAFATEAARQSAHAAGTFYTYSEGQRIIRVYPDGRKMEAIYGESGKVNEIPYSEA
ncbi:hypothetical protein [Saccharibacillus brassicae]|uniref:Uncharacterized protein n=1 Tax=Saccharibacillus brassicae TaxID=2583377 RepID=A0A4Y6UTS6_SACBS|nr:hypothetical protein [Saccharibacillus brassicae]QDH19405.1 hypothetical protein FFV09_00155 [Saccharibacillus brassicae]